MYHSVPTTISNFGSSPFPITCEGTDFMQYSSKSSKSDVGVALILPAGSDHS